MIPRKFLSRFLKYYSSQTYLSICYCQRLINYKDLRHSFKNAMRKLHSIEKEERGFLSFPLPLTTITRYMRAGSCCSCYFTQESSSMYFLLPVLYEGFMTTESRGQMSSLLQMDISRALWITFLQDFHQSQNLGYIFLSSIFFSLRYLNNECIPLATQDLN